MGFWINTISTEHVRIGMKGGFTQANHGRPTTLKRLKKGDLIAFYSPRTSYPDGEALQEFTAMARVTDQEPYQAEMRPDFHPWRRDVEPLETTDTPIRPLLDRLEFIPDKRRWGLPFRRGLFEVSEADFHVSGDAMGAAIGGRSAAR